MFLTPLSSFNLVYGWRRVCNQCHWRPIFTLMTSSNRNFVALYMQSHNNELCRQSRMLPVNRPICEARKNWSVCTYFHKNNSFTFDSNVAFSSSIFFLPCFSVSSWHFFFPKIVLFLHSTFLSSDLCFFASQINKTEEDQRNQQHF